jgi:hypothetical protein
MTHYPLVGNVAYLKKSILEDAVCFVPELAPLAAAAIGDAPAPDEDKLICIHSPMHLSPLIARNATY